MFNLYYSTEDGIVTGSINYDNYKNVKIRKSDKGNELKFTIDETDILDISSNKISKLLKEVISNEELLFDWYKYFIHVEIVKKDVTKKLIKLGFNNVKAIIDEDKISPKEILSIIHQVGIIFFHVRIRKIREEQYTCDIFTVDKCIKEFIILALLVKIGSRITS